MQGQAHLTCCLKLEWYHRKQQPDGLASFFSVGELPKYLSNLMDTAVRTTDEHNFMYLALGDTRVGHDDEEMLRPRRLRETTGQTCRQRQRCVRWNQ
jgi:hypothetical protein